MNQKYDVSSKVTIPHTRLVSYQQFCKDSKHTIRAYIQALLATTDTGLSCREISQHSGIEVQSLTNPLRTLQDDGLIVVVGHKVSVVTNRSVQLYGLTQQADNE